MAKPNYSFEKRQRELAKKKKQEEKRQRKATHKPDGTPMDDEPAEADSAAVPPADPSKTA